MITNWKTAVAIDSVMDRCVRAISRVFLGRFIAHLTVGERSSHRQKEAPRVHVSELMLPPASAWTGVLLCFGAAVFPLKSAGQSVVPSGVETSFLGVRSGDQVSPAISLDADGGFLVWEDNTIETSRKNKGIAAVRIGSDWNTAGTPFQVNGLTAGDQVSPQTIL